MGMDGLPCGFHEYGVHCGVAFLLWSTFTCVHGLLQRKQGTYRYEINSAAFPIDIEIKKVIKLQVFKRYPSLASLYIHNQTAFIIIRQFFIIFFSTLRLHEYIIVPKPSSSISPPLNPSPPPPHHTHWRKTTQGEQGCTKLCAKLCEETPTPLNHSLNKFWLLHTNSKDISVYVIGRKSNNFSILDTNLKSLTCTVEDI